jgi:hypothetical protein
MMSRCTKENPPCVPLFQRGMGPIKKIPLFEKEGLGEIFSEKASD